MNPDLVGASASYFVACELSVSPSKDLAELEKYAHAGLTSYLRSLFGGGRERGAAPFFITTESGWSGFPRGLNGINVSPAGGKYLADVTDLALSLSLEEWAGFTRPPPSYALSAVPESDPTEIKKPLAGVLRLAGATGDPLSAEVAAKYLSGDLWKSFTQASRRTLTDKVATLLEQAGHNFEGEATWDSRAKVLTIKVVSSPAGRKATDRRIAAWLGTRFITDWVGEDEDDEAEEEDPGSEEDDLDEEPL
jgi:hypothetical protein